MKYRFSIALVCALLAFPMRAALSVSFNGSVVHVKGATARGQVAVFSIMREGGTTMIVRLRDTQQLRSTDTDGTLDLDLGKPIPSRSVWAVVDVVSGESVITAPGDFPTNESALPAGFVKNAPADEFDTLVGEHLILHVLWVRPGPGNSGGAWFLRSADGGLNDTDRETNGHAVLSTSAFVPLGDSGKAPKKLKRGDVLVLLDPFAMTSSRGVITQ